MTWSCRRGAFHGTGFFLQVFRKTKYVKDGGKDGLSVPSARSVSFDMQLPIRRENQNPSTE
jgi:hypothetical protein